MYRHILIPVDGSPASRAAANAGVALARRLGAHVTALHVLPPPTRVGLEAWAHADPRFDAKRGESLEECGTRFTHEVREVARQAGVSCECRIVRGAVPHSAILDEAHKLHCDLIALGAHGHKGDAGSMLGSVAVKVMTAGDVPVLVQYGARGARTSLVA